jgi:hypothetical protein
MQNHLANLKEQLYGPEADPETSKWMHKVPGVVSKVSSAPVRVLAPTSIARPAPSFVRPLLL